jgi:hypothetical protein
LVPFAWTVAVRSLGFWNSARTKLPLFLSRAEKEKDLELVSQKHNNKQYRNSSNYKCTYSTSL